MSDEATDNTDYTDNTGNTGTHEAISGGNYAGFASRVSALSIDVAVVTAGVTLGSAAAITALGVFIPESTGWPRTIVGMGAAAFPFLYFALSWWLLGQTPGDVVLGIRVVRTNGSEIGPTRAALRSAVGLALAIPFTLAMPLILVDPERRALHDRLFGTAVLYNHHRRPITITASRQASPQAGKHHG